MSSSIKTIAQVANEAKNSSKQLRVISGEQKINVLKLVAQYLLDNKQEIIAANELDLEYAKQNNLSAALLDRLKLDSKAIDSMSQSVLEIAALSDPVGQIIEGRKLANGLSLQKKRIPLGVVAVIFESRPNVTIDIGALCFKSSNVAILRGGKEALHSNIALHKVFQQTLVQNGLDPNCVQLITDTDRELMLELLQEDKNIDLVVPRGGAGLINFVSQNSKIPVVKHDAGICHLYIDVEANLQIAADVLVNGKIQKPSVCNALETIIINRNIDAKEAGASRNLLSKVTQHQQHPVTLYGDEATRRYFADLDIKELTSSGYATEYLDYCLSVKVVESMQEAIDHINQYGSGHSEVIISQNIDTVREFEQKLDSAAIFVNCSTRFHDGGQLGYGAEVGIATGKLHCRGPMGLVDLTTYKFVIEGNGQVRP